MSKVIVSYDGTRNDRDALALGRLFAHAGAEVALAYVRHAPEADPQHEATAQQEAEHLLAVGASQLGAPNVGQHIIFNRSTADGLTALATELDADVVAFGSSYRTPPGRIELPHTAEQLLDGGGAFSVAIAPAGLRREPVEQSIGTVSVYDEDDDQVARASAKSLAHALAAAIAEDEADLLVITSRSEAIQGHLLLSATGREHLEQARSSVLAMARGAILTFSEPRVIGRVTPVEQGVIAPALAANGHA